MNNAEAATQTFPKLKAGKSMFERNLFLDSIPKIKELYMPRIYNIDIRCLKNMFTEKKIEEN
jgi:hypothetical protein